jgi:hypothetical protein
MWLPYFSPYFRTYRRVKSFAAFVDLIRRPVPLNPGIQPQAIESQKQELAFMKHISRTAEQGAQTTAFRTISENYALMPSLPCMPSG